MGGAGAPRHRLPRHRLRDQRRRPARRRRRAPTPGRARRATTPSSPAAAAGRTSRCRRSASASRPRRDPAPTGAAPSSTSGSATPPIPSRRRSSAAAPASASRGTAFADRVFARGGDDRLLGHRGADRLAAGPGDDLLVGGPGRDRLIGGEGADTFVFAAAGHAKRDRLPDFEPGTDRIDLREAGRPAAGPRPRDGFRRRRPRRRRPGGPPPPPARRGRGDAGRHPALIAAAFRKMQRVRWGRVGAVLGSSRVRGFGHAARNRCLSRRALRGARRRRGGPRRRRHLRALRSRPAQRRPSAGCCRPRWPPPATTAARSTARWGPGSQAALEA